MGEIEIPSHKVDVFDSKFISRRTISKDELLKNIKEKILKVSGDFRQEEILDKWRKILTTSPEKEFAIDKISIKVSSGFYVRQFVSDLASEFSTSAITFHIKRTKVGDYDVSDCE